MFIAASKADASFIFNSIVVFKVFIKHGVLLFKKWLAKEKHLYYSITNSC